MHQRGHYDRTLLFAVMALLATSIVMVYSSSSVVALTIYQDPTFFMKRQILWGLVGLSALAIAMHMNHRILSDQRMVLGLLVVTVLLLALTFVPGVGREINGARRWIKLLGLTFQPTELAKLTLVVYLSYYIAKKGERIREFTDGLVPALVVTALFVIFAALQPDFGAAVVLAVVSVTVLFAGGANAAQIGAIVMTVLPFAYLAVAGTAYRLRRIFAFLDPWSDPQGAGHQIIQSFLAFGSGGIFGRGLGEGRQKLMFLPERHSDFIYAVIGEELGLIGAAAVLILFLIILWRGVKISLSAGDLFGRSLALGITFLICIQGLVNMAVVTGLIPTKGIALPLVSYGGSSLLVTLVGVGVLLNISKDAG